MNDTLSRETLIQMNAHLFWSLPASKKKEISDELLVEYILNYGNEKSVKGLFDLMGIDKVAEIFNKIIKKDRINLYPPVVNYFKLYFEKHVH